MLLLNIKLILHAFLHSFTARLKLSPWHLYHSGTWPLTQISHLFSSICVWPECAGPCGCGPCRPNCNAWHTPAVMCTTSCFLLPLEQGMEHGSTPAPGNSLFLLPLRSPQRLQGKVWRQNDQAQSKSSWRSEIQRSEPRRLSRMEGQRRHGSNTRERAAAESTEGHSEEAHLVPHREAEGAGPETTTSCQQAETLAEKVVENRWLEREKAVHRSQQLLSENIF